MRERVEGREGGGGGAGRKKERPMGDCRYYVTQNLRDTRTGCISFRPEKSISPAFLSSALLSLSYFLFPYLFSTFLIRLSPFPYLFCFIFVFACPSSFVAVLGIMAVSLLSSCLCTTAITTMEITASLIVFVQSEIFKTDPYFTFLRHHSRIDCRKMLVTCMACCLQFKILFLKKILR